MGDLVKRLKRLEAVTGPEPTPPEIWFCADGWCHRGGDEVITRAELDARPCESPLGRIHFVPDDEANEP